MVVLHSSRWPPALASLAVHVGGSTANSRGTSRGCVVLYCTAAVQDTVGMAVNVSGCTMAWQGMAWLDMDGCTCISYRWKGDACKSGMFERWQDERGCSSLQESFGWPSCDPSWMRFACGCCCVELSSPLLVPFAFHCTTIVARLSSQLVGWLAGWPSYVTLRQS